MRISENNRAANGTGAGMKRRTLVKGAVWSVPVVAAVVATPLAAASVCIEPVGILDWGSNFARTGTDGGTGTVTTDSGQTVTYAVSITYGPNVTPVATSPQILPDSLVLNSLIVTPRGDTAIDANFQQTISIVFDTPVENLTFRVRDIDAVTTGATTIIREAVRVPGAIATPGSEMVLDSGFYRPRTPVAIPDSDLRYSVQYGFADPRNAVTIEWQSPATAGAVGRNPGFFIDNMSFTLPC